MNNNLLKLFEYIDFSSEEIEELLEICPGLKIRNTETIIKCTATLTAYGFPRSELKNLILLNPHFLLGDPDHIKEVVSTLDGDIVKKLFENPYLI